MHNSRAAMPPGAIGAGRGPRAGTAPGSRPPTFGWKGAVLFIVAAAALSALRVRVPEVFAAGAATVRSGRVTASMHRVWTFPRLPDGTSAIRPAALGPAGVALIATALR